MAQRPSGRPQVSVTMRFPIEIVEYLDALVEQRRARDALEERQRNTHRADILVQLLEKVKPSPGPNSIIQARVRDAHDHAFGSKDPT